MSLCRIKVPPGTGSAISLKRGALVRMQGLRFRQPLQRLSRPQVLGLTCGAAFWGKAGTEDKGTYQEKEAGAPACGANTGSETQPEEQSPIWRLLLGVMFFVRFMLTDATLYLLKMPPCDNMRTGLG